LLDGKSISTIISSWSSSNLNGNKGKAMGCMPFLIHMCHRIDYYVDDYAEAESWIVTEAGKVALKKALNHN
jgi:hypothetical protein